MLAFVGIILVVAGVGCMFCAFKIRFDRTNQHGVQEYGSAGRAVAGLAAQRLLTAVGAILALIGALIIAGQT